MTIQWFPGHMAQARRQIEQKLKLIDIVLELLDARIPMASRNPMIGDILRSKPRLVLLNKADLADRKATDDWVAFFRGEGHDALPIDASSGAKMHEIVPRCKQLLTEKIEAQLRKGINPRAIRALVVGIPNVGKSTLINRLAGRSAAAVGDRPGVTKAQQWIRTSGGLELLDTPGILWPKFEDPNVGLRLAATGAIKEEILPIEEVAFFAVREMAKVYPDRLIDRFSLEGIPNDLEDPETIFKMLEQIGRMRGCLKSGGIIDLEKASGVFLRELRSGKIGEFSLEYPAMLMQENE